MSYLVKVISKTSLFLLALSSVCYGEISGKAADNNWQTISGISTERGTITSIGTDDQGTLYETGNYFDVITPGKLNYYWITQKSTDKGQTWTTIDKYPTGLGRWANPQVIAADHLGNLFVAGNAQLDSDDFNKNQWVIRKGADNGKTWSTVDTFKPYSSVLSMVVDKNNNIYAAGSTQLMEGDKVGSRHALLRKAVTPVKHGLP